jgi:hypothetical protein
VSVSPVVVLLRPETRTPSRFYSDEALCVYSSGGHFKSARTPTTLNEVYCGFPQSIQTNVEITLPLLPFKSLPVYSPPSLTPYSLTYWQHRKANHKNATETSSFLGGRMSRRCVAIFSELSRHLPVDLSSFLCCHPHSFLYFILLLFNIYLFLIYLYFYFTFAFLCRTLLCSGLFLPSSTFLHFFLFDVFPFIYFLFYYIILPHINLFYLFYFAFVLSFYPCSSSLTRFFPSYYISPLPLYLPSVHLSPHSAVLSYSPRPGPSSLL